MKIRLLAVGQRQAPWIVEGFCEYAKRLPFRLELVELPAQHRKAGTVHKIRALEADKILAALRREEWVVLLDEAGDQWPTERFARHFAGWREAARPLAFVVGGADGVESRVNARADETLALASGTYPHGLVRVMLAEQLYRAWSVTEGHPYHRP